MKTRALPLAILLALAAGSAQAQSARGWTAAPGARAGFALGTMAEYLGTGYGMGIAFRGPPRPLRFHGDVALTRFGARTVHRRLNGTGPFIGITSNASVITMVAGPEAGLDLGGWRLGFGWDAGVTHVQSTGSTILAGDPSQVLRSNTYGSTTWAVAVRASGSHALSRQVALNAEASVTYLGQVDFLREYNLPIGVISGIYLYPTPYRPRFASAAISLVVGL